MNTLLTGKKLVLFIVSIFCFFITKGQDLKSFQIYDKVGNPSSFDKMTDELKQYDVVLFGELHNNSIIHWLELKTEESLYQKKEEKLILGAEMFERDNQAQIDSFLSGTLNAKELGKTARLWPNFNTDYKPLLDFARDKRLSFVATNVPRRYAALVAKQGLDSLEALPETDKAFIARLPIKVDLATPGYSEMVNLMKDHAGDKVMNFISAQALKDATMAESIKNNLKKRYLLLHFNGNYHSKEYGGIFWYLKKEKKRLKVAVISVAESADPSLPLPEDFIPTDFNIVIPSGMTKTY